MLPTYFAHLQTSCDNVITPLLPPLLSVPPLPSLSSTSLTTHMTHMTHMTHTQDEMLCTNISDTVDPDETVMHYSKQRTARDIRNRSTNPFTYEDASAGAAMAGGGGGRGGHDHRHYGRGLHQITCTCVFFCRQSNTTPHTTRSFSHLVTQWQRHKDNKLNYFLSFSNHNCNVTPNFCFVVYCLCVCLSRLRQAPFGRENEPTRRHSVARRGADRRRRWGRRIAVHIVVIIISCFHCRTLLAAIYI